MNQFANIPSKVLELAQKIEDHIREYFQITHNFFARDYLVQLSKDFLNQNCPDAINLSAALVIQESNDEAFIAIHLDESMISHLTSVNTLNQLLSTRAGLNAFMILTEEISHFYRYLEHANSNRCVTKFDLELQAELEKPMITALILNEVFGRSHILEIIHIFFNEASYCSDLTNYKLASKTAEKFWKELLRKYGTQIIFNSEFRRYFQEIPKKNGIEKLIFLQSDKFVA